MHPAHPLTVALLATLSACALDRVPRDDGAFGFGELSTAGTAAPGPVADDFDASIEVPDAATEDGADRDGIAMDGRIDGINEDRGDMGEAGDLGADEPGPEVMRFVGACASDGDCADDEICIQNRGLGGTASYCAQACTLDGDCAPGPGGAPTVCSGSPDGSDRCQIPCDALQPQPCPNSMTCHDQLLFLSGGACLFTR